MIDRAQIRAAVIEVLRGHPALQPWEPAVLADAVANTLLGKPSDHLEKGASQ